MLGVYVPAGALWGGEDIAKMADSGSQNLVLMVLTCAGFVGKLSGLIVRMKKHPQSLKLVQCD